MDDPGYALPAPVYETIDQPKEQIYLTIGDFKPSNTGDGLSFNAGVLVSVITKNPTGWWYVDLDGVEGWVPSSYLESTSSKPPSPPAVSNEPPPPLPARNSVSAVSKKDLFTSSEKPIRSTPIKEKTLPKKDHTSVTRIKTVGLSSSGSKSSLRRSQSTESLDRDIPPKPSTRRANSPPAIHISSGTGWKPKPGPTRPAITVKSPTVPKRSEAKKPAITSVTMSPRTARLTKAQISDPLPHKSPTPSRHTFVSKTISYQTKSVSPRTTTATLSTSKSNSSLHTPENNTRSTSVGSRPAKPTPFASSPAAQRKTSKEDLSRAQPRKVSGVESSKRPVGPRKSSDSPPTPKYSQRGGDSSGGRPPIVRRGKSEESVDLGSHHLSELEGKLKQRGGKPSDNKLKKATPPQRPSAPPSRPKNPPRRPDPPRPTTGGKKVPPPRPAASPLIKKNVAYVSVGDYVGEVDNCLTFSEGDWVNVIEKNDDGWWFVEIDGSQGWAPSSFLEEKEKPTTDKKPTSRPSRPSLPAPQRQAVPEVRNGPTIPSRPRPPPPTKRTSDEHIPSDTPTTNSDTPPINAPRPKPRARTRKASTNFARATSAYQVPAYEDGGVALVQGRLYEVKERRDSGWWLVKDGDLEGWAPASHFENI